MKRGFFIIFCLLVFLLFYGDHTLYSSLSQAKTQRSDKKIETFCSKIDPDNPYCKKRAELKLRRLELKSLIYKDLEKFCQNNPKHKFCLRGKLPTVFVLCDSLFSQSPYCQEWQSLKQQELENKGFLFEEIERFCKTFPKHSLCK